MCDKAKRSRASGEQLSAMLDFFISTPNLASGKFQKLHGKLENKKKWTEMAAKLNAIGGAVKTVEQWQNVWRDLKSRTSTHVRDLKKEQNMTGNRPLQQTALTNLEKKVIDLVGITYMEGESDVNENIPMQEDLQLFMEHDEDFQLVVDDDETPELPSLNLPEDESE
ncbi:uncharacterized protein [Eurosta solidaginis]|uniref:uncharacterized protein n=1 Tax=Eurosta solidaginis TaxID=178769 RepID=UPI00353129DA